RVRRYDGVASGIGRNHVARWIADNGSQHVRNLGAADATTTAPRQVLGNEQGCHPTYIDLERALRTLVKHYLGELFDTCAGVADILKGNLHPPSRNTVGGSIKLVVDAAKVELDGAIVFKLKAVVDCESVIVSFIRGCDMRDALGLHDRERFYGRGARMD